MNKNLRPNSPRSIVSLLIYAATLGVFFFAMGASVSFSQVIFQSDWETATGTSAEAIRDGGKWTAYKYDPNLSVVSNPPPGGPGGNALKIHWDAYNSGNCTDGSNNFVELFHSLPNPFYARVYFYSGSPNTPCGGRKFMYFKNRDGVSTCALYLYQVSGNNMRLLIKNHATTNSGYNCKDCEHLDGTYNWPGKASEGIIEPNKWYCIEFAHYRHNTNGWLKAWLNGKLVINASKEAWGVGSYDTDTGFPTNWVQIPSFRNGGSLTTHDEYIDGFVISSSSIGSEANPPPNPPTGLTINPIGLGR